MSTVEQNSRLANRNECLLISIKVEQNWSWTPGSTWSKLKYPR